MKKIIGFIVIGLVGFLAGCNDFGAVLDQAKTAPTPAEALKVIWNWESDWCKHTVRRSCDFPKEVEDAEAQYFEAAARAGTPFVLRTLYIDQYYRTDLQAELKTMVLEKVSESDDPDLLLVAASIVGNERLGPINDEKQLAFLNRAWKAGAKQAAGYLANIYARTKDYETAYYWALQCNANCRRDNMTGFTKSGYDAYEADKLGNLEKHLSPKAMARIQSALAHN